MALVTLTTSNGAQVRIDPAAVAAIEQDRNAAGVLSDSQSQLHLSSGTVFIVSGSVATVATTLGL